MAARRSNEPTLRPGRTTLIPLVLAFGVVGAGFLASSLYGESQSTAIDEQAAQMEGNALPSVEHLSAARTSLRHLEVEADQYAEQTVEARESAERALDGAREEIDRELMDYLALPSFSGEREQFGGTKAALADLDVALASMRRLAGRDEVQAKIVADRDVRGAVERVDGTLRKLVELNTVQAHEALSNIAHVRRRTLLLTYGLDAACILLSIGAAVVAVRAVARQRELERAHERILEERADELEVFANRVAHDLLSPLSALSFTLSAVRRNAERGQSIAEPLARAAGCLRRSQRLVDGILEFARAGAAPAGAASAGLRETVDGVVEEVRADDDLGVEIVVEPFDEVTLACAPGVLASLLSNLLRNAVKYMGPRDVMRVTVRALPRGELVRVEVEDTGPGLPRGLEAQVFEPYVRAPDTGQPGLGLGLSTVRRLVEAHGGHVGVRSEPDRGCLFWFELPRDKGAERDVPTASAAS